MNAISAFFFGTVSFSLSDTLPCDAPIALAEMMEALREKHIYAKSLDNGFCVFRKDRKQVQRTFAEKNIAFSMRENPSLPGFLLRYRRRYGILTAVGFFIAMQFLMSDLLLNIEIVGAKRYPKSLIKAEVVDCGLTVGSLWHDLDIGQIETQILSSSERIGWVSVNRRGMTAYVEITEREPLEDEERSDSSPSNIVADFDAVISDIEVRSGKACVKAGDTVKKGDILISGIGPGLSKLEASGSVQGILSGDLTVFIPRTETCREPCSSEILRKGISVFDFDINFFEKYRNSQESCDIIEKKEELLLPNGKSLPLAVLTTEAVFFRETVVNRSEAEMIALGKSRIKALLLAAVAEGDMLSMKSSASFTEEGYSLTVSYTYTAPLGKSIPIVLE